MVSVVTSVGVIFNFEVVQDADLNYDVPIQFRIQADAFNIRSMQTKIFYFFHYILNDLVLLLVNLVIDICLIRLIKLNLAKKFEIRLKNLDDNKQQEEKLKAELKSKRSVENKSNAMIVATLFVYFFCRLPELGGAFFFYFFKMKQHFGYIISCDIISSCYLLANIIEYSYMVSYITNVFFYYKFNKDFSRGLRMFLSLKPIDKPTA